VTKKGDWGRGKGSPSLYVRRTVPRILGEKKKRFPALQKIDAEGTKRIWGMEMLLAIYLSPAGERPEGEKRFLRGGGRLGRTKSVSGSDQEVMKEKETAR